MNLLCLVGLHSRIHIPDEGPLLSRRWGCRRCDGQWHLLTVGQDVAWSRLKDRHP